MPDERPRLSTMDRPTVGVIGAGRTGSAIGGAFVRAGYRVVAGNARSAASRERARRLLPDAQLVSALEVSRTTGLVIVAVPDDDIESVVTALAEQDAFREGQLVIHLSGRCGLGVLAGAELSGAVPLALHPAMTFAGTEQDVDHVAGLPFGVTAPPESRELAEEVVISIGGVPVWIPEAARTLYHASMCFSANHLIALVAGAMETLEAAGVRQAAALLGPLLHASLENALTLGDAALTGPVQRGDAGTVAAHLEAMSETVPSLVPAYRAMAGFTARRAIAAGRSDPEKVQPVLDLVDDECTTVR